MANDFWEEYKEMLRDASDGLGDIAKEGVLYAEREQARRLAERWRDYAITVVGVAAVYGIHGDHLSRGMPEELPWEDEEQ
jgi:hypothetical protein